jgi:hypothetical protein
MLRNFFKPTIRNLWKNRGYSFLKDELSYDPFLANKEFLRLEGLSTLIAFRNGGCLCWPELPRCSLRC